MKIVIGIIIGVVLTVILWEFIGPLAIAAGIGSAVIGPAALSFLGGGDDIG